MNQSDLHLRKMAACAGKGWGRSTGPRGFCGREEECCGSWTTRALVGGNSGQTRELPGREEPGLREGELSSGCENMRAGTEESSVWAMLSVSRKLPEGTNLA